MAGGVTATVQQSEWGEEGGPPATDALSTHQVVVKDGARSPKTHQVKTHPSP